MLGGCSLWPLGDSGFDDLFSFLLSILSEHGILSLSSCMILVGLLLCERRHIRIDMVEELLVLEI